MAGSLLPEVPPFVYGFLDPRLDPARVGFLVPREVLVSNERPCTFDPVVELTLFAHIVILTPLLSTRCSVPVLAACGDPK